MRRENISILSVLVIVCLSWPSVQVNGANILGLFTSHSPSHLIVHMSVVKVLAENGHNVTVVASSVPKVNHENIKLIIVPPTVEEEKMLDNSVKEMAAQKNSNVFTLIRNLFGTLNSFIDLQADILRDPRFTVLYENPDTKFDLVIHGLFMNTYQMGVAAKFKAPIAISLTGPPMLFTDIMVGNPSAISYLPGMNMAVKKGEKISFFQRLQNFISNIFFNIMKEVLDFRMRTYYKEFFPNDGSFPSLSEMGKNVSLIFCNSHFSEGGIRPNVPAIVEIGGIQVKEAADPLPQVRDTYLNIKMGGYKGNFGFQNVTAGNCS